MVKLVNIHKSYTLKKQEIRAVDDVSLEIHRGEIFGIIGYSGAGKSTLIRCINLLERPTKGQVMVNGQELTSLPADQLRQARQKIGMIFQQFNLLSSRTVADNVAFPLEIAGQNRDQIQPRVHELLELVGLSEKADAYPAQLSGGQKQRVGIARALANHPDLLLCDEATSALDPRTTQSILDLLRQVNQRLGLTVILVTHEMQVVQSLCERVAVMENGQVVESGRVQDLFSSPKSAAAKQFLSHAVLHPLRSGDPIPYLEDTADV